MEGRESLKALKARAPSRAPWGGEKLLKMDDDIGICDQCKRPLMRIDRYGEEFVGCVACSTDFFMELFEDGTRAFEQMLGAKSFERVIEIQSQYAKKAFDTYVAELSPIWKSIRRHGLAEEPQCRECAIEGRTIPANQVPTVSGRFSCNTRTPKAYVVAAKRLGLPGSLIGDSR